MRAPEVERQSVLGMVEELRACDLVHDMSSSHCFADVKHETGSCHHLVTINGISWITPHYKHNVVVLSEAARQAALTGEPAWPPEYPQWRVSTGTLPGCEVVHYGTDTAFYEPDTGPFDHPINNVLYVGRPHPSKGCHVSLDIAERMPEYLFIFAWRPEYPDHIEHAQEYEDRAAHMSNVVILELPAKDHHKEKRALYQDALCFLQPTQYTEAFGLTAIEALACGTPVILASKGSAPEIVQPGKTGFLCGPDLQSYSRGHPAGGDARPGCLPAGRRGAVRPQGDVPEVSRTLRAGAQRGDVVMKNYTSLVPVSRTVARIEECLAKAGASGIMKEYCEGKLTALSFSLLVGSGKKISIRLPAKEVEVYNVLVKAVRRPRDGTMDRLRDQACRTAWKLQQDFVEVQLSLIEMRQTDAMQAFLAYVWDGKRTFYEALQQNNFKALPEPKE